MADDDANFTVRLINEVMAPARDIKRDVKGITDAFKAMDDAMAHQDWVKKMRQQAKQQKTEALKFAADVKKARMGGFDMSEIALGATESAVLGLAGAIGAAGAAQAYLAFKVGETAVEYARFAQNSIQALTQLTGSGAIANTEFNAVRHEAAALGLEVESTVKGFQKLLAAQFEIGKAKELIRMGADLQVIGASGEEVQRVLMAITQIKSKGKLQAEEMLQLQEAGVSAELVYDALGKQFGKTRQELAKLQQQGKIDATSGIEAILEAVRHKTGTSQAGEAARNNPTMDASFARLHGDITNAFIDIGQAITPTLEKLTAHIPELFRAIRDDPAVADLGAFLLNQFEGFGLWVEANWPQIKDTVLDAVHAIDSVIRAQFAVIETLRDNWEGIKAVLGFVAGAFGVVAAGGALLLAPLFALIGATGALVAGVVYAADQISSRWGEIKSAILNPVNEAIEYLRSLPEQLMQLGSDVAQGIIDGFESRVQDILDSITSMGDRAIEALRAIWRSHSPAEAFADVGEDAGAGVTVGMDRSVPAVESASSRLGRMALASASDQGSGGDGGRSGGPYEFHFHAEIMPGATEDDGRRFAEGMRPVIRREVQAIFEGEAA